MLWDTTRGGAFGQFRTPSRYIKASRSWRSMARKLHQSYSAKVATLPGRPGELSFQCRTSRLRSRWVMVCWTQKHQKRLIGYKCITWPYTLPHFHHTSLLWVFRAAWATLPQSNKKLIFGKLNIFMLGQQTLRETVVCTCNGAAISRQDGSSSSWTWLSPWKGLASPWLTCVGDIAWEAPEIRGYNVFKDCGPDWYTFKYGKKALVQFDTCINYIHILNSNTGVFFKSALGAASKEMFSAAAIACVTCLMPQHLVAPPGFSACACLCMGRTSKHHFWSILLHKFPYIQDHICHTYISDKQK